MSSEWNNFVEGLSPAHQFLADVYQTIGRYFLQQKEKGVSSADFTFRSELSNLVIFEFGAEQLYKAIADELKIK